MGQRTSHLVLDSDSMQRYEGKLEPQSLALSSGRRRLADTNLHQVSANHEFARKALACRQQLFSRCVARHNVAEDKLLHACRFGYPANLVNRRMAAQQMLQQAFFGDRTRRHDCAS
jgi:hypothetical protein